MSYLSITSSTFRTEGFEENLAVSPSKISGEASFSSWTLTQNDFSDSVWGLI